MLYKNSNHPSFIISTDKDLLVIQIFVAALCMIAFAVPHPAIAVENKSEVIQMTDQGMHPSRLEIARGTTVFFVNTGKFKHWPASNNHPSHELYPDLDAKQTIAPGASWKFTFTKLGNWKLHDHLNPGFEALVTVVDQLDSRQDDVANGSSLTSNPWLNRLLSFFRSFSNPSKVEPGSTMDPAATPSSTEKPLAFSCAGKDANNFECYKTYYTAKVRFDGIQAAISDAKQRERTDAYALSMCHPIVHVIGHAAVAKFDSVAAAFKQGDGHCWSGYYHGVMEGIIARIGREHLPEQIGTICSEIPGKENYSFDFYNCIHGLGHGVMAVNGIELFDSLELCAKLDGNWEQSSCYSGVFMENVMVDYRGQHTKYLKAEDPVYPCNAVKDQYKQDCFMMQTSYMLKVVAGDFTKVFALCDSVEQGYQKTCYQSLGRDAASRSSNDVLATKSNCDLANNIDAKTNCIIGASKNFVSALHDNKRAKSLCNATDAGIKSSCLAAVEQYYQIF